MAVTFTYFEGYNIFLVQMFNKCSWILKKENLYKNCNLRLKRKKNTFSKREETIVYELIFGLKATHCLINFEKVPSG